MKRLEKYLFASSLGLALVLPARSHANEPSTLACKGPADVNCVDNGVLVLEGTQDLLEQETTQMLGGCQKGFQTQEGTPTTRCAYAHAKVAEKVVEVLKAKGLSASELKWDQIALFYADSEQVTSFGTGSAMMFHRVHREGTSLEVSLGDAALSEGVNEVGGIGQTINPRNPNFPFVGFVTAGSTTTFGNLTSSLDGASAAPDQAYDGCGPNALCASGINGQQALAQATSQMFGPFLNPEPGLEDDSWYALPDERRSECHPRGSERQPPVPLSLASPTLSCNVPQVKPVWPGPTAADMPNLLLNAGFLGVGTDSRPRWLDRPVLTVCPDNKINLAVQTRPPSVYFQETTNSWECDGSAPRVKQGSHHARLRPRIWNSFLDMDVSLMGGGVNWEDNGNGTSSNAGPATNLYASAPYRGKAFHVFHPLELWLMGLLPVQAPNPLDGVGGISALTVRSNDLVGQEATLGSFQRNAGPRMGQTSPSGPGVGAKHIAVRSSGDYVTRSLREMLGTEPARTPSFEDAPHVFKQLWVVVTKPVEYQPTGPTCPEGQLCPDPDRLAQINRLHVSLVKKWRKDWQQYWYMLTQYRGKMLSAFDTSVDDAPYWEFMQATDDTRSFVAAGGLRFAVSGARQEPHAPAILSFMNVATPGSAGTLTVATHSNQPPLAIDARAGVEAPLNALSLRLSLPPEGPQDAFATVYIDDLAIRIPSDPARFLKADGDFHTYVVDLTKLPGYLGKLHSRLKITPSNQPVTCTETNFSDASCLRLDFVRLQSAKPEDLADADVDCDGLSKPDGLVALVDNCPTVFNPEQMDINNDGIGDACQDQDSDGVINACDACANEAAPTGCPAPGAPPTGGVQGGAPLTPVVDGNGGCNCNFASSTTASGGGLLPMAYGLLLWWRRRRKR